MDGYMVVRMADRWVPASMDGQWVNKATFQTVLCDAVSTLSTGNVPPYPSNGFNLPFPRRGLGPG